MTDIESCEVGFREVVIPDGLLRLNGQPLLLRGVNRHEHDQHTGHTLSRESMELDIRLMKQHNFNAVRNAHYPNHPLWYRLCDRFGLYMVDEANLETHGAEPFKPTIPPGIRPWSNVIPAWCRVPATMPA